MAASPGSRAPSVRERPVARDGSAHAGGRALGNSDRPLAPVLALATRQHGVVTWRQLLACGLSRHAIARRVAEGHLIRLSPGVYAVGHLALGWSGERMAAVLACGAGAVLSHADAAVGARLLHPRSGPIHVTCPNGHPAGPDGVIVHRGVPSPDELTEIDGIPMTTPLRTLLDLAATGEERDLAHALREAQARRLVRAEVLLSRSQRRRGARLLRVLLADEPGMTRSEAERRLLRLLRRAGLPVPLTNVRVGRYEVDVLFPEARLVVEVDGFAFHRSRQAFEADRARDAALQAAGYRVMRFTWRHLVDEPELVVAQVAAALARSA